MQSRDRGCEGEGVFNFGIMMNWLQWSLHTLKIIIIIIIIIIKKNWCAAGLELTTLAPSRTIVTDGNC